MELLEKKKRSIETTFNNSLDNTSFYNKIMYGKYTAACKKKKLFCIASIVLLVITFGVMPLKSLFDWVPTVGGLSFLLLIVVLPIYLFYRFRVKIFEKSY